MVQTYENGEVPASLELESGDNATLNNRQYRRSGKWTKDEESYTKKLIQDFKEGGLSDCIEGTTLRGYLSVKLGCDPMRISKKLAGLRMGKVFYQIYDYFSPC